MVTPNDAPSPPVDAVKEVASLLQDLGAVPLEPSECAGVGKGNFASGWKLKIEFEAGRHHVLAVMLPEGFPYAAPRIAVLDAPDILSWPHLEDGRLLCVLPPGASFNVEAPADMVRELLHTAVLLVQDVLAGRLDDDFET